MIQGWMTPDLMIQGLITPDLMIQDLMTPDLMIQGSMIQGVPPDLDLAPDPPADQDRGHHLAVLAVPSAAGTAHLSPGKVHLFLVDLQVVSQLLQLDFRNLSRAVHHSP